MQNQAVRGHRELTVERAWFPPDFNAAAHFIDRHLAEGRAGKIAIRWPGGDVSYADLAAHVNRAAHAFQRLGLARGDRVLMIVKDCPAFFYVFWGAIKAGFVPVRSTRCCATQAIAT